MARISYVDPGTIEDPEIRAFIEDAYLRAGVQVGELVRVRPTGVERLHACPRGFRRAAERGPAGALDFPDRRVEYDMVRWR